MSKLFALLFLVSFGCAVAKITNSNFVILPNYTYGAFTFFYSDQIVVGLNVFNNITTGNSASLAFYSLKGTLEKTYDLPGKCSSLYCNSDVSYIDLQGPVLTVLFFPDALLEFYQLLSINLDTLTVVAKHSPPRFFISDFFPAINSSTVLFTVQPSGSDSSDSNVYLGTLSLPSLTPTLPELTSYPNMIPSNSFLLSGVMYTCASEGYAPYDFNFIQVALPSLTFGNDTQLDCEGYVKYDSSLQQVLWINTTSSTDITLQFYSILPSNDLQLDPTVVTVGSGAYATDFAISPDYAFVAGRLWANQGDGYIYQVATSKGKATVLDSIQVPDEYLVGGFSISDYNSAIDETSMTYVVLTDGPMSNYPPALFILNFDGN